MLNIIDYEFSELMLADFQNKWLDVEESLTYIREKIPEGKFFVVRLDEDDGRIYPVH